LERVLAPHETRRLSSGLSRSEERRLVAAARAGDPRALGRLLKLLAGPIYRFGRGFCGDRHDAEDVAQVVLMALARTVRSYRGEASLTTWAYTVARNACKRHRRPRAGAPRQMTSLDDAGPAGRGAMSLADPRQDPHRSLERTELARALERAIAALPPAQRDVLLLRDVEGLPASEVGRTLGLSERAVKSRLHRARVALRDSLAPWHGPEPEDGRAARDQCPDTARLLSRYLEGELGPESCAELRQHVESCPACAGACDTLRSALLACRAWRGAPLPRAVQASVRRGLREAVAGSVAKS
jgi:RNA polymerase sigma-70 factor (ECF subfamily)